MCSSDLVQPLRRVSQALGAISAGGGLSIPYRDGDPTIDTEHYFGLWNAARKQAEAIVGHQLALELEPGRFLVAESGVLLGTVGYATGTVVAYFTGQLLRLMAGQ